jgi:hypothetical protein
MRYRHFSALGKELVRPTPVHKRRRFVGLVKDAKLGQIWDGNSGYMDNVG